MSEKPARILAFIRNFILDRGYSPTVGEIQKGCNICSKSVVHFHLAALEREGQIRREVGVTRGIHLPGMESGGWPVPLLGFIAAGEPIPVPSMENRWSEEMVEIPRDFVQGQGMVFALKVRGTLMTDALVDDGDIVILESRNTVDDGDMVAVWLPDKEKATLKKLYHEPGRIRLQPANRNLEPTYVHPNSIEVHGKVIAVLRRLK